MFIINTLLYIQCDQWLKPWLTEHCLLIYSAGQRGGPRSFQIPVCIIWWIDITVYSERRLVEVAKKVLFGLLRFQPCQTSVLLTASRSKQLSIWVERCRNQDSLIIKGISGVFGPIRVLSIRFYVKTLSFAQPRSCFVVRKDSVSLCLRFTTWVGRGRMNIL